MQKLKIETSILGITKIGIIIFVSLSLIFNFQPFFNGWDEYAFGLAGMHLAKGSYGYTNDMAMWDKTPHNIFMPVHWVPTQQEIFIPLASPLILGISAFSFLVGGYYGLFYAGPIIAILFLITTERITTNLFGRYVGLFVLVFLAFDWIFWRHGIGLLSDHIFSIFFVLGCFFLIKFLKNISERTILLCSIFFTISAFSRFSGIIFFPIEILLVIGYLFYLKRNEKLSNLKNTTNTSYTISVLSFKKISVICFLMIIPWIAVFSFYFSFNDYYFGEPTNDFYHKWGNRVSGLTIISFDIERFDLIKWYSKSLVPDLLSYHLEEFFPQETSTQLSGITLSGTASSLENLISFLSFLIIGLAIAMAFYYKKKRIEIIVFLSFIFGFLLFFSSEYTSQIAIGERFMLPILPLSFSLVGFLILGVWKEFPKKISSDRNRLIMIFKISFLIMISIFLIFSFIYFNPVQKILKDDFTFNEPVGFSTQISLDSFTFNDPVFFANRYPLDMEDLTEKSIIVSRRGMKALDYNVIPFTILSLNHQTMPDRLSTLKQVISEGHDVFTFKEHVRETEPIVFRHIESEHNIILKNYSKTFCKFELIENSNKSSENEISKSDDLCYMWKGKVSPKFNLE